MAARPTKKLNLALQGGGAHGAYTWGVLDRLLEEEDIVIDSISGTSAGAMNAVALADGYLSGGREGAKQKLAQFWGAISQAGGVFNPTNANEIERFSNGWNIDGTLGYTWFDMLTRMFSPYQFNPLNINPLQQILDGMIDWKRLQKGGDIHLFLTATSVHSGQARVFSCHEITQNVVLASSCIPFFFQAVMIDGEPYWDGGYMGNPSLWPLIYKSKTNDVLLVQINPIMRDGTPDTANEIINRLNEITFNSSLIAEMRAIHFVSKLIKDKHLKTQKYRDVRMHVIESPDAGFGLNASSKVNTDWRFLSFLHEVGRQAADDWIKTNKRHIGLRSSIDISTMFLDKKPKIANKKPR